MAAAYQIVLAHNNLDAFAAEVECAVGNVATELSIDPSIIEFSTQLTQRRIPQVVAYLGTDDDGQRDELDEIVHRALESDVSILPVVKVDESEDVTVKLPESIAHINAASWQEPGTIVAALLLEILGLVEKERKLFISYKRSETSELAEQLHTELEKRRFDVFLDRFSVEPGVDFQRRLDEDLGDKAFLLVLESKNLRKSKWVNHEISYAHARRLETLALTLPNTVRADQVQTIDEAFRYRLDANDILSSGLLTANALSETIDKIEIEHAQALRRRREQILGSIIEKLRMEGCQCSPTDDWCILASKGTDQSGLFWVTPRRPKPRDFFSLSLQCERIMRKSEIENLQSTVVHDAGQIPDDHRKLLDWLSLVSGSRLATIATCSLVV